MADESTSGTHSVWILVDQSSRAETFESVAGHLESDGTIEAQIVTITEVLGTMARGALAGGAERLLRGLRVAFQGRGDEDLVGAVKRDRPDLLVVTDPRYVRALGLLENLSGIPSLQVGVLPDYNMTPEWQKSPLQAFVVPHESFKRRLVDAGYPEDRVRVAGPPIQARFAEDVDRVAAREEFGFAEEQIVLVRANTFDAATLEKLVFQSTLVDSDARFVFHHDGDQSAASALRKAASQYGLRALMFGNVDDFQRYVAAADLVVGASNDPYVAEIVALDRPLLFVGDEGSHGEQVDFLTRESAASHVADLLRLGVEVDRCLKEESQKELTEAAARLSQKNGSKDVAEALAAALENREEWLVAPDFTPAREPEGGEEEDAPSGGAFEVIGKDKSRGGESSSHEPDTDETQKKRDYSGISKSQAKEQLAAMILMERDLERRLEELERQQTRWRNRLELAREWNESDLAEEAEEILRGFMGEAEQVGGELGDIRKQKEKLKMAAHGRGGKAPVSETSSRGSEMESRFRKMEVDKDLESLKDRIRRELGE